MTEITIHDRHPYDWGEVVYLNDTLTPNVAYYFVANAAVWERRKNGELFKSKVFTPDILEAWVAQGLMWRVRKWT